MKYFSGNIPRVIISYYSDSALTKLLHCTSGVFIFKKARDSYALHNIKSPVKQSFRKYRLNYEKIFTECQGFYNSSPYFLGRLLWNVLVRNRFLYFPLIHGRVHDRKRHKSQTQQNKNGHGAKLDKFHESLPNLK